MLTVTQLAKKKGVYRQRIHQLIQEGRIKAEKVGSVWIIKSEKIKPVKIGRPPKES